jgi:hypothetical protein
MRVGRRLMAIASASVLVVGTAVAVAQTAVASAPAQNVRNVQVAGPIGGGWREHDPPRRLQIQSRGEYTNYPRSVTHATGPGGSYDRSGGVETFRLFNNGTNRVEVRVQDNYTSGQRQFEGELRVSAPTNNESAMQIFGNDGSGATTLMVRSYSRNGGTLRGGGKDLATNIYGKWVRVNVIHDATANKYSIYINGALKASANGPNGTHYFKYGVYGTLRTASAQHQWRDVHFYQK